MNGLSMDLSEMLRLIYRGSDIFLNIWFYYLIADMRATLFFGFSIMMGGLCTPKVK